MKSRAPSGVDLISVGVSTSRKPAAWWASPDGLNHTAPQEESVGHRLATDIEIAVLQSQALVDRLVGLVDVERRRLRLGQDLDLTRPKLDLPRRHARVLGPGQARATSPATVTTNSLRTRLRDLVGLRRVGLVDDDLGDAVPVAQVQEDELAVVAAPMHPPGEPRVCARI